MEEAPYIDGHCHLTDPRITPEMLPGILERSRRVGVGRWILGGVGPEDWARQRELAREHGPFFYPVYGIHPWWLRDRAQGELGPALEELARWLPEAVALGELGLDFGGRADGIDRELQLEAFRRQLRLARETGKPLVIHCVRAHSQVLAELRSPEGARWSGLVHSFSGGPGEAQAYLELGLALSISGGVTKRGFTSLKKAVRFVPPESLVVETDSPDQAPDGFDGAQNEPASLIRIAQAIAALREERTEEVLLRSAANLERIFGLKQ